jgi:hypothetical protein
MEGARFHGKVALFECRTMASKEWRRSGDYKGTAA